MQSINTRQVLPTQCFIIMINLFNFDSALTRGHHFTEDAKSHHNLTYWTDHGKRTIVQKHSA